MNFPPKLFHTSLKSESRQGLEVQMNLYILNTMQFEEYGRFNSATYLLWVSYNCTINNITNIKCAYHQIEREKSQQVFRDIW
jgi:hypothetical protein